MTPATTPTTPAAQVKEDPFRYGWRYESQQGPDGTLVWKQVPLRYEDLLHPQEEDHIVNNQEHAERCLYLQDVLERVLNGEEGAVVLFDARVDWQIPGVEPLGPDLALMRNVDPDWVKRSGTFQVKKLHARTELVIEVTSPTARTLDLSDKVIEYHRAGVPIFALVDYRPEEEDRVYVIGYRATPEGYVRLPLDENGRLWLEPLRIWLAGEGEQVVCYNEQNERLLGNKELGRQVRALDARNEELDKATEEAILARHEAERLSRESQNQASVAEKKAADEAFQRAEAERRNIALLARLAELEAQLKGNA